jgi:signal transduction histidine kinase
LDLEKKTFLIILATLTVVAGVTAALADRLVLDSFRALERDEARSDLDRLVAALHAEQDRLKDSARDWAYWDDAYAFVGGSDPGFPERNLLPNTFEANRIAVMLFLDADGRVVYAAAHDPATGSLGPPPARLSTLTADDPLLGPGPVSGLIASDDGFLFATAWPILTSLEEGPAAGTLVWARTVDPKGLSETGGVPATLRAWTPMADDLQADERRLTELSRNHLRAEARIAGLDGAPLLVLQADLDRPIYRQGVSTLAYVLASSILIGGGIMVAMIVLLNTTVLSRLKRLTDRIEALGQEAGGRVDVSGADEITRLAMEFNALLDRVDRHQARLEASNADLRQFAAVVSHDLQPPLSTIALNAAVLREHLQPSNDAEAQERLARIEATALRMATHIRSILDYSRVTYERPALQPTDLSTVMGEVVAHLEERLQATQGRIEYMRLPTLEAHPTQMVQLLQNLVGNGLRYHRAGVPPIVRVTGEALDQDRVRITVEDNGEGFDVRDLDRMRRPYIRLPGKGREGHGLGLATADRIVERHHGRLWAESTPGVGSRFHVELPLRP